MLWDRCSKCTSVLTNTQWLILCARCYSRHGEQSRHRVSLSLTEVWDATMIPIMVFCVVGAQQLFTNLHCSSMPGHRHDGTDQLPCHLMLSSLPETSIVHPSFLIPPCLLTPTSFPRAPHPLSPKLMSSTTQNLPWPVSNHPFSIKFSVKQSAFTAFSSLPQLHSNSW